MIYIVCLPPFNYQTAEMVVSKTISCSNDQFLPIPVSKETTMAYTLLRDEVRGGENLDFPKSVDVKLIARSGQIYGIPQSQTCLL